MSAVQLTANISDALLCVQVLMTTRVLETQRASRLKRCVRVSKMRMVHSLSTRVWQHWGQYWDYSSLAIQSSHHGISMEVTSVEFGSFALS